MLKVIIVDDERPSISIMERLLNRYCYINIENVFTDSEEALIYLSENKVDAVFLDIEMPKKNGLELANEILEKNIKTDVIFTTAYHDHALEAFEVNAIDYLLKPIAPKRLDKTIAKIMERHSHNIMVNNNVRIKIESFGGFHVYGSKDGGKSFIEIKFRTSKARELLAFLYSHKNKHISRDKVFENLYSDISKEKAATLLHTATYYLKKVLEEYGVSNALQYKTGVFLLNIDYVDSDSLKLEKYFLSNNEFNEKSACEFAAISRLYKGEFLEGTYYQWGEEYKSYYEKIFTDGMFKLVNYYFKQKQYIKCIEAVELVIIADPMCELYYEFLVKSYFELGDRYKAKKSYKRMEDILYKELGVKPRRTFNQIIKN